MAKNSETIGVRVFRLANRLRRKLGQGASGQQEGHIDGRAIAEADQLIEALCAQCPQTIGAHLETIEATWEKMRDMTEGDGREKLAGEIFTLAHEIKDVSSMCGFSLISFFAESLRDYIAKTELSLKAQRVIVQAHIDAMRTTHKRGLKEDGGPLAEELKALVKVAVGKYS